MSLPKPLESGEIPAEPPPEEIDTQRALPRWGAEATPVDLLDERVKARPAPRARRLLNPWASMVVPAWLAPPALAVQTRTQSVVRLEHELRYEPLPPPAGSTPCPCPPRYFPCPLTREDRKRLDAAEPVMRRFQQTMETPSEQTFIEQLGARVEAGEKGPPAPPWLEQRMVEAGLADDERELLRLLFQERPELADLPGSAIVLTRRDPTTGEDLGPALVDAASFAP